MSTNILNKWDDVELLFKVDEYTNKYNNETISIFIATHKLYGIVFIDNMGYALNKFLILDVL